MSHILIVDDEPQIRSLLSKNLRHAGFDVTEAEDGNVALKLLEGAAFDLMILDLIMPGKEGLETLMVLRRKEHHMKIIAVSGGTPNVSTDILKAAQKLGADITLKKPFRNEELLAAIHALL